eukprot:SM000242S08500  [mRNA]  locus=s242:63226:64103:- [translate_table: standard]
MSQVLILSVGCRDKAHFSDEVMSCKQVVSALLMPRGPAPRLRQASGASLPLISHELDMGLGSARPFFSRLALHSHCRLHRAGLVDEHRIEPIPSIYLSRHWPLTYTGHLAVAGWISSSGLPGRPSSGGRVRQASMLPAPSRSALWLMRSTRGLAVLWLLLPGLGKVPLLLLRVTLICCCSHVDSEQPSASPSAPSIYLDLDHSILGWLSQFAGPFFGRSASTCRQQLSWSRRGAQPGAGIAGVAGAGRRARKCQPLFSTGEHFLSK